MGFILYQPEKLRGSDEPIISLGKKSGTFNINTAGCKLLGLESDGKGRKVNIFVDPDTFDIAIAVTPRGSLTIRVSSLEGQQTRGQLAARGIVERFNLPRGKSWALSQDVDGDAYVIGRIMGGSRPSGLPDAFRR